MLSSPAFKPYLTYPNQQQYPVTPYQLDSDSLPLTDHCRLRLPSGFDPARLLE